MSHSKIAATFDQWVQDGIAEGLERGHGDVVGQVLQQLDIRAGDQILDLGCGTGWATRLLAQAGPGVSAVGVDISPEMVAKAEAEHVLTIRARYTVKPFEDLGFKDGKFQHVFSMEALYYAADLDKAIAEIHRVLAPGGRAEIVVDRYKERPDTEVWAEEIGLDLAWLSADEWADAFRAAGFSDVTTQRVVDSRGPGEEADFKPSRHYRTFAEKAASYAAGSLWIRAQK